MINATALNLITVGGRLCNGMRMTVRANRTEMYYTGSNRMWWCLTNSQGVHIAPVEPR